MLSNSSKLCNFVDIGSAQGIKWYPNNKFYRCISTYHGIPGFVNIFAKNREIYKKENLMCDKDG